MERKLKRKVFEILGISREVVLLWKFLKMLLYLQLEIAENLNGTIWLNGKRPIFPAKVIGISSFELCLFHSALTRR